MTLKAGPTSGSAPSSEHLANTRDCKDQENYKQREEQARQELRDRDRGARNRREAQNGGNDADNEEHQRELQHGPPLPSYRRISCEFRAYTPSRSSSPPSSSPPRSISASSISSSLPRTPRSSPPASSFIAPVNFDGSLAGALSIPRRPV